MLFWLDKIKYLRINAVNSLCIQKHYTVKPVLRGHLWDKEKVDI